MQLMQEPLRSVRSSKLDLLGLKGNASPRLLPLIRHFVHFVPGQISRTVPPLGLGGYAQLTVALMDNLVTQLAVPGGVHHELGRTKRQVGVFIDSPGVHSLAVGLLQDNHSVLLDLVIYDV